MAFAKKIGSLFKNAINSSPSIYQSIHCMSSSKIFFGGISYSTDDQSLGEAFTSFGEVIEARIILDQETRWSRGFGFVTFTSEEEASAAISGMDGKDLRGRMVRVNYANDPPTGGSRGGGGYDDGGYPGGDGGVASFSSSGAGVEYGGSSNYSSGDSGASSFSSSAGGVPYGSGAVGGGGGFGKEDDVLDSMKDDNYEPNDYANKQS